jgi:hypothetical protein
MPGVLVMSGSDLHLSGLTLGEIRTGIDRLRRRDPSQAEVFAHWLTELRKRFTERILAIDMRVADEWGRVKLSEAVVRSTAWSQPPPASTTSRS